MLIFIEFLVAAGLLLVAFAFPVIGLHVNYKGPARYDDLITTELWLTELSGIRLTFGFRMVNSSGAALVEGETRHICASTDEKPRRLPKELAEQFQPFLRGAN